MNELYKSLFNARDNLSKSIPKEQYRLNVLSKILVVLFENNDKLPDQFFLCKVFIGQSEVEELLKSVGIDATVITENNTDMGGNFFRVKLN